MPDKKINMLVPTAEVEKAAEAYSLPLVSDLNGKVVGFVSNVWTCLNIIWPRLEELLPTRYRVSNTFITRVPNGTAPPLGLLDEVAGRSDAVIVGLGN